MQKRIYLEAYFLRRLMKQLQIINSSTLTSKPFIEKEVAILFDINMILLKIYYYKNMRQIFPIHKSLLYRSI